MLDLYDIEDGQKAQLIISRDKFNERIEMLKSQRQDIDESIRELKDQVKLVERLLDEKTTEEANKASVSTSAAGYAGNVSGAVK